MQRRPWSFRTRTEAEIRVEERTSAEVKARSKTVFNKDEMIDVTSYTRDYGDSWGAPGANCLRGNMQIVVKMLTDRTITFDVGDQ